LGAGIAFPTIVPATVFGQNAPSNRINIGVIGAGRIARVHDMAELFKYDHAQILAICDLDSKRVEAGKRLVNETYAKKYGGRGTGTAAMPTTTRCWPPRTSTRS
jgi:hypothetical protein